MHLDRNSLLFLNTNVFIEHLFIPTSPAAMVINYAAQNIFKIGTCEQVIKETETIILRKLQQIPESLNTILERWTEATAETNLIIFPDPSEKTIKDISHQYLASMRHKADIPILAAAILAKPKFIISNNREHFNDIVAQNCRIPIYSCAEFIESLEEIK